MQQCPKGPTFLRMLRSGSCESPAAKWTLSGAGRAMSEREPDRQCEAFLKQRFGVSFHRPTVQQTLTFLPAAGRAISERELDRQCEAFLKQRFGEEVDFAIEGSLASLVSDGLVHRDTQVNSSSSFAVDVKLMFTFAATPAVEGTPHCSLWSALAGCTGSLGLGDDSLAFICWFLALHSKEHRNGAAPCVGLWVCGVPVVVQTLCERRLGWVRVGQACHDAQLPDTVVLQGVSMPGTTCTHTGVCCACQAAFPAARALASLRRTPAVLTSPFNFAAGPPDGGAAGGGGAGAASEVGRLLRCRRRRQVGAQPAAGPHHRAPLQPGSHSGGRGE
jgi:hypothetical protein